MTTARRRIAVTVAFYMTMAFIVGTSFGFYLASVYMLSLFS